MPGEPTLKLQFPHLGYTVTASLYIDENDVKIWLRAVDIGSQKVLQSGFQDLMEINRKQLMCRYRLSSWSLKRLN